MNSLVFVTIGFVEHHKGQDLLIKAIKGIREGKLANTKFLIIGNNSSLYARELENQILDIPCVNMVGTMDRKRIHEILSESNVLICPSREDSMPTVCAEAMLHKLPCIVSDATGTSIYIEDEVNGLVFPNEDVDSLREKIIWCIDNSEKLCGMGENAYKIYKQKFSMEAFEDSLLKCVKEMI